MSLSFARPHLEYQTNESLPRILLARRGITNAAERKGKDPFLRDDFICAIPRVFCSRWLELILRAFPLSLVTLAVGATDAIFSATKVTTATADDDDDDDDASSIEMVHNERTHCRATLGTFRAYSATSHRPHLGPPRILWMGIGERGFGEFPHYKLPVSDEGAAARHFLLGLSPPLKSTRERGREMPLARFPEDR